MNEKKQSNQLEFRISREREINFRNARFRIYRIDDGHFFVPLNLRGYLALLKRSLQGKAKPEAYVIDEIVHGYFLRK